MAEDGNTVCLAMTSRLHCETMNEKAKHVNLNLPESLYRQARGQAGFEAMSLTAWIKGLIVRALEAEADTPGRAS